MHESLWLLVSDIVVSMYVHDTRENPTTTEMWDADVMGDEYERSEAPVFSEGGQGEWSIRVKKSVGELLVEKYDHLEVLENDTVDNQGAEQSESEGDDVSATAESVQGESEDEADDESQVEAESVDEDTTGSDEAESDVEETIEGSFGSDTQSPNESDAGTAVVDMEEDDESA